MEKKYFILVISLLTMFKLLPGLNSEREKLINIENIPLIAEFVMPSTSDHMRNKNVDI
jgi:hypothetical protein